ncbi:hypothetical protein K443DRAFT_674392 [Laccaria amethystina LaAM-08-1]|uniref:Fungal lipase-type domain-containing protein n=1 Tax=Laccaria amethystina LaAM-08-1 TaxID=1095629 RepID=A0A0C9XXR8_9AGAR|nr:hypothetical protein K443DRAFT_674392 [Laccaria amethystina LaAM-08-1]
MYAAETTQNFRWISQLVATYSPHTLTSADRLPPELELWIAEIGQFAEVAYCPFMDALFEHREELGRIAFPLEHYHMIHEVKLVASFKGAVANLPVSVVHCPKSCRLIVGISGTSRISQAIQDLRVLKTRHPTGRGYVHTGFWNLYQGIRAEAILAIKNGLRGHPEDGELVLTGHSMGGSIAYLLLLDLLTDDKSLLQTGLHIKIVVFGVPRAGDAGLVQYLRESMTSYRRQNGEASMKEYSVRGYNDGVPALPLLSFGYRHFAEEPIYTIDGRLYRIPSSESEHTLFHVVEDGDELDAPIFPRGGHNYYNRRELEVFVIRLIWIQKAEFPKAGWEERYMILYAKYSRHTLPDTWRSQQSTRDEHNVS